MGLTILRSYTTGSANFLQRKTVNTFFGFEGHTTILIEKVSPYLSSLSPSIEMLSLICGYPFIILSGHRFLLSEHEH